MVEYTLGPKSRFGSGRFVIRTSDGTAIQTDPKNPDYVEYLKWVAAGNVPEPYVPPTPPTPDEIYDKTILNERVLRAVVLAINNGSLTVGGNKTGPQLKNIIKAMM